VVLGAHALHGRPLGLRAEHRGLGVEGLDLGRHGVVLVGHGAVGDAGVADRHPQRPVAQQRRDRLEAHPPVDGLGGQRVA
jgi:hypothetical protein